MSSSNRMTPQDVSKKQRKKQSKEVLEEEGDFLEVDNPIPGQNFVCMSFLSPESAIKERYLWYIKEFLQDLVKPIPKPDTMSDSEYTTKLHSILTKKFTHKNIKDIWEDYIYSNNKELSEKYDNDVTFQSSMRGLKIRGVYDSYGEAKRRSTQISRFDKNHNVYIGQVGYWLPWDPDPHEVPDQEYHQKELNTLMKKYQENLMNKEEFFHARNKEKMEDSLRKNKLAKKASEESKKELDKVRKTVDKKNEILQKVLDEKKKREAQETENKEVENKKTENKEVENKEIDSKETINVFNSSDPWMDRKMNQKE